MAGTEDEMTTDINSVNGEFADKLGQVRHQLAAQHHSSPVNDKLTDKSDDELMSLLRIAWGYDAQDPLELIGQITKSLNSAGAALYWLSDLRSVKDGSSLPNPYDFPVVRHRVFVSSWDVKNLPTSSPKRPWIKARVTLSPLKERKKHGNPFALTTVSGSLRLLSCLPDEWDIDIVNLNDRAYFEDTIVSMLRQQHIHVLEQEWQELETKKQTIEAKNQDLTGETEKLEKAASELNKYLQSEANKRDAIFSEITTAQDHLRSAQKKYNDEITIMDIQLNQLHAFIEKRAKNLLDLDLIDQASLNSLIGMPAHAMEVVGHSLENDLNGSPQKTVQYIQTYLYDKGIYYTQALISDFFALLRTNDLIILAGESGSGKTNLVKSFAKAIGGKSVVLPVKPNWSSSEDLLGYYNPIEKRYLPTPFLNALIEAGKNPDVPYLICLDEMNLARVEYYFADFLSLLEERNRPLEIHLYSSVEQAHTLSEYKIFLKLIDEAIAQSDGKTPIGFANLLKDDQVNQALHKMCGFHDGDSLLKYHAHLRRLLGNFIESPSEIRFPSNVRIIGAINVDDTTHYLSPKILDRAHIIRFDSPLLQDWDALEQEIVEFDLDLTKPLSISAVHLGERADYPKIDRSDELVKFIFSLTQVYLTELGVEVGLRTIRQATNYANELRKFGASEALIRNNFVIHKIFPKLMFDGQKAGRGGHPKIDILKNMRTYLANEITKNELVWNTEYCVDGLDRIIMLSNSNDSIVNYWST